MPLIIEGKECACLGDPTSHGSPLAPGPGALTVLYNGRPIWRVGIDFHACPVVKGLVPDVGGVVTVGATRTMIMGAPAARKTDVVTETPGGPNAILPGAMGAGGVAGQVMGAIVGAVEGARASVVEAFESPAVQGALEVAAVVGVAALVVAAPEALAGAAIVEGAELAVGAAELAEGATAATEGVEAATLAAAEEGTLAEGASLKVSEGRAQHILDGDATGGGHGVGRNIPGKSEFRVPDDEAISSIEKIANDPSIPSVPSGEGPSGAPRFTKEGPINFSNGETHPVKVVTEPEGEGIVTGYPKVPRNPK